MSSPSKSDRLGASNADSVSPRPSLDSQTSRFANSPSPKPGASKVKGMAARWENKPDNAPPATTKAQPKRLRRPTIGAASPRSGSPNAPFSTKTGGGGLHSPGGSKLSKSPGSTSPVSFKSVDPKSVKAKRLSGGSSTANGTTMARSGSTGATATDALAPSDADPGSKSDTESFVSTLSPGKAISELDKSPSFNNKSFDTPTKFDSVPLSEDDRSRTEPELQASNGDVSPIKLSPALHATSPLVEASRSSPAEVELRVEPPAADQSATHVAVAEDAIPNGTDTNSLSTPASATEASPVVEASPVKAALSSFFGLSPSATPAPALPADEKGKGKAREEPVGEGHDDAAPVEHEENPETDTPSAADKADTLKPDTAKVSAFFASAQKTFGSFSLPSVTLPAVTRSAEPAPDSASSDKSPTPSVVSPAGSEHPASLDTPVHQPGHQKTGSHNAANWRTTMSNTMSSLLRGQANATPPPPLRSTGSSSAAFILKQIDSPTSARDRRISREAGGNLALREGFERVRNEMEGAARELRRDRAARGSAPDCEDEVDWTFWGAVVQDYEEVARTRPKELSRAIQQGIPPVIRGPIWQLMSSAKDTELEETYKALLKLTSPHEKAIHKDLARTFPNHQFFQGTGTGQESLFMVIKAYSLYDREVGYTQGLAFVVAALLLHMPDEEAFCVLVRLMDSYNLRSHYLADMPGLQLRLYQFDRLVEDCLPLLHNHIVRKGIKSSMFASQWFMTLFSYRFPLALVYRVFDIVLAEGTEAMFRFSLALLRRSENELLKLNEFEDILHYLSGDLFEVYRAKEGEHVMDESEGQPTAAQGEWHTNSFVRDAYDLRITPLMLDAYESEWTEKCRAQTAHLRELEGLRSANRHLSAQVKTLEASVAAMNTEHVDLVKELVMAKIAKEEMETELVKYKALCAQLAQSQPEEVTPPSRRSSDVPPPLPRKQSPLGSPLFSSAMPGIKRVASALSQRSNTSNHD